MLCVIVIKDNSNYFNNLKITIADDFSDSIFDSSTPFNGDVKL